MNGQTSTEKDKEQLFQTLQICSPLPFFASPPWRTSKRWTLLLWYEQRGFLIFQLLLSWILYHLIVKLFVLPALTFLFNCRMGKYYMAGVNDQRVDHYFLANLQTIEHVLRGTMVKKFIILKLEVVVEILTEPHVVTPSTFYSSTFPAGL